MALHPTVPLNRSNKPKGKGPDKASIIFMIVLLSIVVSAGVSGVINHNKRIAEEREAEISAAEEASRLAAEESSSLIPEMQIIDDPETSIDLPVYDNALLTAKGSGYVINSNLGYSDMLSIAEDSTLKMGGSLAVVPIRSCLYEFTGSNRLNIIHSSGVTMSIKRGQIKEMADLDKMDEELKAYASELGATSSTFANVYIGTKLSGRYANTALSIGGEQKNLLLAYLYYNGEFYTIVSIADSANNDFMYVLLNSVSIGSRNITFE